MTAPKYEKGVVVGNTYDKYGTRNPLARFLVKGFLSSFDRLVERADPETILEVGCGEGLLALRASGPDRRVLGTDLSGRMIQVARQRCSPTGPDVSFRESDLFDLDPADGRYDLVVCCEVLEHLQSPEEAILHLKRLSRGMILLSVPREPIWRILNLARGRYVRDLGNTPGHLQHWSRRSFLHLVRRHLTIIEVRSPFPWTMVLAGTPPPSGSDQLRTRPSSTE